MPPYTGQRAALSRFKFALLLWSTFSAVVTHALVNNQPVSTLVQQHAAQIAKLKSLTTEQVGSIEAEPYSNDVFYLRYCLEFEDDEAAAQSALENTLAWRLGDGKSVCAAASEAVAKATAEGEGKWNNEPVLTGAPNSALVTQFLTPDNCITTTTSQSDLVYCIRAGQIDDAALMEQVTVDQVKDFFLYAKEVNHLVSLQRSAENDKLVSILAANDLSGIKLVGGSADFRSALSASSKEAAPLYPATNGPTLLLNLPVLVSALVKIFTPLFPESVRKRLRFEQGPLSDVDSLLEIAVPGAKRDKFLEQLDSLVYD